MRIFKTLSYTICILYFFGNYSSVHSTTLKHLDIKDGLDPMADLIGKGVLPSTIDRKIIERVQNVLRRGNISMKSSEYMKRTWLSENKARCNDNSKAGYYHRLSKRSRKWIVYLEGGWYCYDKASCDDRRARLEHLMTSKYWPEYKVKKGILSPDFEDNPYWWNANHIYVPYCSSDSWSGAKSSENYKHNSNTTFDSFENLSFMGSLIIDEVIKDLLNKGLSNGHTLILAGSSAGGVGVILNIDRINDQLRRCGLSIDVRGISDSGWFLDNEPYAKMNCLDAKSCPPIKAIKRGIHLWDGRVPEKCVKEYSNDIWNCYLGYRLYPFIQSEIFVFQWIFDKAQMTADNVGKPASKEEWNYIHNIGLALTESFKNVTTLFAPSCISHTVLTKQDWYSVKIGDVSLPEALHCWAFMPEHILRKKSNKLPKEDITENSNTKNKYPNEPTTYCSAESMNNNGPTRDPTYEDSARKLKIKKRRRHRRIKDDQYNKEDSRRKDRKNSDSRNRIKMGRDKKKRSQQELSDEDIERIFDKCQLRITDNCAWPQCNQACPKLLNTVTGEEINFVELLKSFGLDMKLVATEIGVDLHTLNSMEDHQLLKILTQ